MNEFLIIGIIVNTSILFGVIVFIWIQLNSTDSKLVKLIEDRIRLNQVLNEIDRFESLIKEETDINR